MLLRLVRSFSPVLTILATLAGMGVYFVGEVQQAKAEGAEKAAVLERRIDARDEAIRAELKTLREEMRAREEAQLRKWERVDEAQQRILERLERRR